MSSQFSVPVYEPSAYTYTGLTFNELPLTAQHYLANIPKPTPSQVSPNPDIIQRERDKLSTALMGSLEANDIALVKKRHEVYQYTQQRPLSPSPTWEEEAAERDKERLLEVLGVLLPERQRILDDFMVRFNALVWLEADGRERYTEQYCQNHRHTQLAPILERTYLALIERGEAVTTENLEKEKDLAGSMDRHATIESENWRATPRTPKYRSTWPDPSNSEGGEKATQLPSREAKHLWAEFHNEAPRYGELWHRRRKMSARV